MLLHVWLAAWEMECCQPELTIGDTWGGSFYLGPVEPWWSRYAQAPLAAEVRDLGIVEFDGDVLRPARKDADAAFVSLGAASVGVFGAVTAGRQHFRGRLGFERHGGGDPGAELDDLDCRGTVRRLRGISYVYGPNELEPDDEEMAQVPIAQNEPRDVRTTFDGAFAGGHEFGTYLVDLDVS